MDPVSQVLDDVTIDEQYVGPGNAEILLCTLGFLLDALMVQMRTLAWINEQLVELNVSMQVMWVEAWLDRCWNKAVSPVVSWYCLDC
jgi:hypothetical protein